MYVHIFQVLRLPQSTISQQSIGRIVNLCSNDVQKFDTVCTVVAIISAQVLVLLTAAGI